MIQLEKQFVSGDGGFGANPLTYKQVVRNDKFAVYERSRDGVVKDYETIKVKILKVGTRIFKEIVAEDTERYPGTSEFGRLAWSFGGQGGKEAALRKYETLNKEVVEKVEKVDSEELGAVKATVPKVNGQRGRPRVERPTLTYPATEQWVMKDLLVLNPKWSQPLAYIQLQKDVKGGVVKEVARIKNPSGRGRAMVGYRMV